jgi:hypothetical protein
MRSSPFLVLLVLAVIGCTSTHSPEARTGARSSSSPELLARIARLDSAMFSAFNAHDADQLGTFFSPDLEFYHDKSGLAGFDTTMANFRRMFERNRDTGMRRDLVAGSLEVYPLGEFGALEVCLHRFCHIVGRPAAVSALDVGRHRHADGPHDVADRLQHFVTAQCLAVAPPMTP